MYSHLWQLVLGDKGVILTQDKNVEEKPYPVVEQYVYMAVKMAIKYNPLRSTINKVKIWNQARCISTGKWMRQHGVHTLWSFSSATKDKIM